MLRDVLAEGVNEDADVRQDHLKPFLKRSAYSRSSIPWISEYFVISAPGNSPPVALLTGIGPRSRLGFSFFAVTTCRRPSSMSAVSVRPSSAALRLASRINAEGKRTVVRWIICQDISTHMSVCQENMSICHSKHRLHQRRREQDEAGVAVRLEQFEAMRRIVDVEPHDLPGQMRGEGDHAEQEY